MIVFLVYDIMPYNLQGIFSTEEIAKSYVEKKCEEHDVKLRWCIERYEVDSPMRQWQAKVEKTRDQRIEERTTVPPLLPFRE